MIKCNIVFNHNQICLELVAAASNTLMKDLSSDEQASQQEIKQAIRFYNRQLGDDEGACKAEVIGMVDGTGEDWEKGQSQNNHKRFMNIEGYK